MQNHVVMFSGGKGSFIVACLLKERYPNDNILLYFTDTLWEDEDLYRFIYEISNKLELPMLIHDSGIDPVELMIKQKILYNSRMGNCSVELKMKVSKKYFMKDKKPLNEKWHNKRFLKDENFKQDAIIYFGIDFMESHREASIRNNWQPYKVSMPPIDEFQDPEEYYKKYDIRRPRLYDLGASHNNCKMRCVKAGQGHYKQLLKSDYETFKEINEIEHYLSIYVGAYHYLKEVEHTEHLLKENVQEMLKWQKSGYVYKPKLNFAFEQKSHSFIKGKMLKRIKKDFDFAPKQFTLDLFGDDVIGGCGCFLE